MNALTKSIAGLILFLFLFVLGASSAYAGWVSDGVNVCSSSNDQWWPRIVPGDSSDAIVTWYDRRAGAGQADIYAQRIDRFGNVKWTGGGAAICTAINEQMYPVLASDGARGVIVAWEDNRTGVGPHIYAQRADSNGTVLWTADGVRMCLASSNQYAPEITTDGAGGTIMVWKDLRGFGNELYAQRVDASGAVLWNTNGVPICTMTGTQVDQKIVPDGSGGAIIAWRDGRGANFDIYVQRVDASGTVQWTVDGAPVCTATGDQLYQQLICDGAGGALIVWEDGRGADKDIYMQHIDATGAPVWTVNGIPLCSASGNQYVPMLAPDGAGGAYFTWRDFRGADSDIYAQRIDSSGNKLWAPNGNVICQAPGNQYTPLIIQDNSGGTILLWQDDRYGSYDLFAQRVNSDGSIWWALNGNPVCTVVGTQEQHVFVSDGRNGAIAAWKDSRPGPTSPDIYVNSINFAGVEKVPTLLQDYTVDASPAGIVLTWHLAEEGYGLACSIYRLDETERTWRELPADGIEHEGLAFTFTDAECSPNTRYRYRVLASDAEGVTTLFVTAGIAIPAAAVTLDQNHPNPFNPSTMISFSLPERAHTSVAIFDTKGALVTVLLDEMLERGSKSILWDGTDAKGNPVSSGVYYCRLTSGKIVLARKMVLVK